MAAAPEAADSATGSPAAAVESPVAAAATGAAAGVPPPGTADPQEDKWVVNKPAERRSEALNEELHDCFGRFMTWVTCGGPAARMRQLYINGRLSKCWDEYTRFKNCLIVKLNPDQEIQVLPGPHPVWHIRTRKQAAAFWQQQYQHLGAAATQADVPEAALKPDLTSNASNT